MEPFDRYRRPANDPSDPRLYPVIPPQAPSPGPWRVHLVSPAPGGSQWHLSSPGQISEPEGHAHERCIAVGYQQDDVDLLVLLVARVVLTDGRPFEREYRITPAPWLCRAEVDPEIGAGWHLYALDQRGHTCIITFKRQVDAAVVVTLVNGLARRQEAQHGPS